MATFKCVRSGNLVSFSNEDDIAKIRLQENYKEIYHDEEKRQETTKEMLIEVPKRRGRPARTVN